MKPIQFYVSYRWRTETIFFLDWSYNDGQGLEPSGSLTGDMFTNQTEAALFTEKQSDIHGQRVTCRQIR